MERRFFWPVVIAAGLHAGLPLVMRRGDVPVPTTVRDLIEILNPAPVPPPEPPDPEEVDYEPPTKGSPLSSLPITDDHSVVRLDDFVFERVKPIPVSGPISPNIPKELPGVGDGIETMRRGPIFDRSMLDNTPRTRSQVAPQYPYEAKSRGVHGEVVVEFTVDEKGNVIEPRVMNSTDQVFERATLLAVSKWRFEPGMRGGRAVRFKMVVPVKFNLNDLR